MKKLLSIFLIALTCALGGESVKAEPSPWARSSMEYMTENNLAEPVSDYQSNITRGEFALLLMNVFEEATQNRSQISEGMFQDLEDIPQKEKILKAAREGLVTGVSETAFAPKEYLSREQAAVIMRNLTARLYPKRNFVNPTKTFSDQNEISDWAKESVGFCISGGFMSGTSQQEFSPKSKLTQEQAILILYNFTQKMSVVEKGSKSSYGNKNYRHGYDFEPMGKYVFMALLKDSNSRAYLHYRDRTEKVREPKQFISDEISDFHIAEGRIIAVQRQDDGATKLVSYTPNSPEGITLAEDVAFTRFAIDGDWIYFSDYLNTINKMRLDGTCRSVLLRSQTSITNITVTEGMIYFIQEGGAFSRVTLDGAQGQRLVDRAPENYLIWDGKAYMLFERQQRKAMDAAYDLYTCDFTNPQGGVVKILDRIQNIYSNKDGVYAYKAEPSLTENAFLKVNSGGAQEIKGAAISVMLLNNGKNLYLADDGSLYYSVMEPIDIKNMVDVQSYMYTNVINLHSGKSESLLGGATEIHSYQELEAVYGKIPYSVSSKAGAKSREVIAKAEQLVENLIRPGMSDYEKEKAIHDYIVLNCVAYPGEELRAKSYEYTRSQNWFNPIFLCDLKNDIYTPYGVLINGSALCEGYALTANLLLNMSGVESHYIQGGMSAKGEIRSHGWNIVKIDGKYYHLDVIANDPTPDVQDRVIYKYFNLSDEEIEHDHIATSREKYPACVTAWTQK